MSDVPYSDVCRHLSKIAIGGGYYVCDACGMKLRPVKHGIIVHWVPADRFGEK